MPQTPKPKKYPSEDRPIECSECKKSIAVRYTEVVGNTITHTVMCAHCPQLEQRLHGIPAREQLGEQTKAGLSCGNCGTTLHSVQMGSLLGCPSCYDVFGDILVKELTGMNKISPRRGTISAAESIHVGRTPGEVKEMNVSARLLALKEALNDTLQREDYEQAAYLRDQIKEITEKSDGK